jgi:hypothetical protein
MSGRAGACLPAEPALPGSPSLLSPACLPAHQAHPPYHSAPPPRCTDVPSRPLLSAFLPACPPAHLPACCCLPAGRRGKDDKGMVFLMVDDALDITTAK